ALENVRAKQAALRLVDELSLPIDGGGERIDADAALPALGGDGARQPQELGDLVGLVEAAQLARLALLVEHAHLALEVVAPLLVEPRVVRVERRREVGAEDLAGAGIERRIDDEALAHYARR